MIGLSDVKIAKTIMMHVNHVDKKLCGATKIRVANLTVKRWENLYKIKTACLAEREALSEQTFVGDILAKNGIMKEIKETTYKGTRILIGNEKRSIINLMVNRLIEKGYREISIPVVQYQETFNGKVGEENNNLMFNFIDNGGRKICLAPEYTAVIQKLSNTTFKLQRDVKLFYVQECFRGEKPQFGRYRQFTQFGVEIINPSKDYLEELIDDACELIKYFCVEGFEINRNVKRGLDYYKDGKGFEISYDKLLSSKQICGGGEYDGGIGFAIGIDRLMNVVENNDGN